ncbi:MAG: relaxase/mobilization nuclease domain-containing protein [Prevotella sp.]|nr:relaxase/mobilization nuclease domain-containing protein [Prevotella sp.]
MIAKGSAISHGATAINYNTNKEQSRLVCVHGLDYTPEADDLWSQMVRHQMLMSGIKPKAKPVIKTALRFELSPENKYTEKWTMDDWKRLAEEFLKEMDGFNPKEKNPASGARPTNLCNSQYVVSLHADSKSGIRHLHILVNRIDNEGNTNDAHKIGERAVHAANVISERRGWTTAQERRDDNIANITNTCYDVLRAMDSFTWSQYKAKLKERGYVVQVRTDSSGLVRGYSIRKVCANESTSLLDTECSQSSTIVKGNSVYKASELKGRGLLASRIVSTWRELHKQTENNPLQPKQHRPVPQLITVDGKSYKVNIPAECMEVIKEELVKHPDDINIEDEIAVANVIKVSLLLFCQYLDAATSISESCGGGGGVSSGWGKKDDEDELAWMRRCARHAIWMCKPIRRNRRR